MFTKYDPNLDTNVNVTSTYSWCVIHCTEIISVMTIPMVHYSLFSISIKHGVS